jgi:hypothetical protein
MEIDRNKEGASLGPPCSSEEVGTEPEGATLIAGSSLSNAFLPQASLSQIMRFAGCVLGAQPGDIEDVRSRYGDTDIGSARRALEILRRVDLIEYSQGVIQDAGGLTKLNEALAEGDLDFIDRVFQKFEPYRIVRVSLGERGTLAKTQIEAILRATEGREVGKEASIRLGKYLVLLGQAWTDRSADLIDGSMRPDRNAFVAEFQKAYEKYAHDALAKVSDVLPTLCRELRISPWAAKRIWEALSSDQRLSGYKMQPAAGGKPVSHDRVLGGSLQHPIEIAVPVDRIELGGRPVFTIEGPNR